jgi:uncharacterized membrane protein
MVLSRFATEENKLFIYLVCIAVVLVVAYLIHVIVEKKMAAIWEKLFSRTFGSVGDFLQKHISGFTTSLYKYALAKTR